MTRLTSFLLFHRGKTNILRKLGAHDRTHAITIDVRSDILRFEVPIERAKQYAADPHWLAAAILLDSESLVRSARPEADDLAIPHAEIQHRPTLSVSDWQKPGNRPRRTPPSFLIAVASVPALDDGSCRVDRRAASAPSATN